MIYGSLNMIILVTVIFEEKSNFFFIIQLANSFGTKLWESVMAKGLTCTFTISQIRPSLHSAG